MVYIPRIRSDLNSRHPYFTKTMLEQSQRAQSDMRQTVFQTKKTIAASRKLLAEVDRRLASKKGSRTLGD